MQSIQPIRVAFLVSGNGGSLKFVHLAAQRLGLPLEIVAVLADRACGGLEYARRAGLAHQQLRYTRLAPTALQEALRAAAPDIVVTNIHKILDVETLDMFPHRFINLHYSLLPAFKGLIGMETVAQARQNNVTIIGATCHEVEEAVDDGRCLAQFAVGVDWNHDSDEAVFEMIFRGACIVLLQGICCRQPTASMRKTATFSYLDETFLFAPQPKFSLEALDEEFWQKVKES